MTNLLKTKEQQMRQDKKSLVGDGQLFEYSKAANPVASGFTPTLPLASFGAELYADGPSRVVPLDLSRQLRCPSPATSPSLLASFVRVRAGERIKTSAHASSEFFYAIRGSGVSHTPVGDIAWQEGDFFTVPGLPSDHSAVCDAAFYMVNDSPLFTYLGVLQHAPRFRPTHYPGEAVKEELRRAQEDPEAAKRSRVSVLLANSKFEQTMTVTHVLWTMYGMVSPGTRQLPHRHQSVALDFVISAQDGVYTLVGTELKQDGTIVDPIRVDWKTGSVFVTPPGYWHEHRNESSAAAYIMPIQDAGLHTYLRTLDIRFFNEDY